MGASEQELIALVRTATPEEVRVHLDAAFRVHEPRILRACIRLVGNPERAQELTQDVFATAVRRIGEFRGDSSLFTWLYSIARFVCLRSIAKKHDYLAVDGVIESADDASGVLTSLKRHERAALVQEVSKEVLDDLEQEAVQLRYVQGVGQQDVGRILGVDGRVILQRCRRKLERALRSRAEQLGHGSSLFREQE